jgi:hypothetical protein
MKKYVISLLLSLLITTGLPALDIAEILKKNIGEQVFVHLYKCTIRYGGDTTLYPLYIAAVKDNLLILKSLGCEVVIFINIDEIEAVEIINPKERNIISPYEQ